MEKINADESNITTVHVEESMAASAESEQSKSAEASADDNRVGDSNAYDELLSREGVRLLVRNIKNGDIPPILRKIRDQKNQYGMKEREMSYDDFWCLT